jgi:Ran GTPase-activating protein (RanGAP) involved in mRNA processing and transport
MKKPSMMRRLKRLAAKAMRLGTRQESVETLESFDRAEALKSFANAAIIAEKLSKFFEGYVESLDVDDDTIEEQADILSDIASVCEDVAETLAEMATEIHEGNEGAGFAGVFNESMDFVLDAVDLYEGMCEDDSEEDESEEDESEEDESEEDESEGK